MAKRLKIINIIVFLLVLITLQNSMVFAAEVDTDEVSVYNSIDSSITYYIKNAFTGQYLDLYKGEDTNNTNIAQWRYNGGKNQQWKFEMVDSATSGPIYKIIAVASASGRVIDVSKGGSDNGLNIALYQSKNSSNQKFALQKVSGSSGTRGAYAILSGCSNYKSSLTVQGKSCAQGRNVIQYNYNKTHNDEWYLEPVTKQASLGVKYAANYAEKTDTVTYPYWSGGDCANFTSQCLAASGIHYNSRWKIYKKHLKDMTLYKHQKVQHLQILNLK